jgi:flagellar motor switch protein FliG
MSATVSPSLKRAATLVAALGTSLPPGLLEALPPDRREALVRVARQLSDGPAQERQALLREVSAACGPPSVTRAEGLPHAPAPARPIALPLPTRSPGEDTHPLTVQPEPPLAWTTRAPAALLAAVLERERPQVAAVVVTFAPRWVAETVAELLSPEVAREVAWAVTRTGKPAPGVLRALDQALQEEVTRLEEREARRRDGAESLARSLATTPVGVARASLQALAERDPGLALDVERALRARVPGWEGTEAPARAAGESPGGASRLLTAHRKGALELVAEGV